MRRIGPEEFGAVVTFILAATPVLAAAEPRQPEWYEVATGVMAIPAAAIGVAYSYLLIKKTRLEARKTELEIIEKERQLVQITSGPPSEVARIIAPTGEGRIALLLLLRFVALWLVLNTWGLLEDAFNLLFTGAVVGAQQLWGFSVSGWAVLPLYAIQKLPKVGYWVVFFALAWPLFREVNAALGIDMRKFFRVFS